jgi:hypothetical protein
MSGSQDERSGLLGRRARNGSNGTFASPSQSSEHHDASYFEQDGDSSSAKHSLGHDGISAVPVVADAQISATKQLAKVHGVKNPWIMYVISPVPYL